MRSTNRRESKDGSRRLSQDPDRCFRKRIEAGLTQMQLGTRSGLSDATVCRIENGDVVASPESLAALAEALGCTVTDLMPAEPEPAAR